MMSGSLSYIGVAWLVLSMLAAFAASCGFFFPYWLRGTYQHSTPVYLGTFRRCNYPRLIVEGGEGRVELVRECGRYSSFADIPSVWWQISAVACGSGSALALLVASAGVSAICIEDVLTSGTSRVAALLQALAGLLIGGGMAVYPLGWDSREVQQVCGNTAQHFHLGDCQLWWAFHLTASAAGVTLLCSLLALCAPRRKRNSL